HEIVVEDHHTVPLGPLLALAAHAVAPGFRGGDPEIGDAVAGIEGADLGVGPEVADQDDLVDAARHVDVPSFRGCGLTPRRTLAVARGARKQNVLVPFRSGGGSPQPIAAAWRSGWRAGRRRCAPGPHTAAPPARWR